MLRQAKKLRVLVMIGVLTAAVLAVPSISWASHQFTDVPDSHTFHADIGWLAEAGITKGCNPPANSKYCPGNYVTRGQMAAFLHRLSGGDDRTLDGRLDDLEAFATDVDDYLVDLEADMTALESTVAGLQTDVDTLQTENATLETTVDMLEADNDVLATLLAGVSRNGNTLTFTAMNLEVLNGQGHTYTRNGLGNVIIGYNEDNGNDEVRTGSHYLVVGRDHTYTRYGGIVVGYNNSATGNYASVSGGLNSTASGDHSSVSGGDDNLASGWGASVLGGQDHEVSGDYGTYPGP